MLDPAVLSIRNILLIPLIALIVTPEQAFCLVQETVKIWKKLCAPLRVFAANATKKKSSFWEIDMTKFEP